jgi:hypothetical protein
VGAGIWPVTAEQLALAGSWPTEVELLDERVPVEVSIEVHTSVGESESTGEHSTCRSLGIISHRLNFPSDQPSVTTSEVVAYRTSVKVQPMKDNMKEEMISGRQAIVLYNSMAGLCWLGIRTRG